MKNPLWPFLLFLIGFVFSLLCKMCIHLYRSGGGEMLPFGIVLGLKLCFSLWAASVAIWTLVKLWQKIEGPLPQFMTLFFALAWLFEIWH